MFTLGPNLCHLYELALPCSLLCRLIPDHRAWDIGDLVTPIGFYVARTDSTCVPIENTPPEEVS